MENFFVYRNGAAIGPYSKGQIFQLLVRQEINQESLISEDGRTWVPYSSKFRSSTDNTDSWRMSTDLNRGFGTDAQAPESIPVTETYKGIGRLVFFMAALPLIAFLQSSQAWATGGGIFVLFLLVLVAIPRFRNIGYSGWRSLTLLIPLFNLYALFQLLFLPANSRKK